jgi:thiol-disulfide isomerase/thioredoxin
MKRLLIPIVLSASTVLASGVFGFGQTAFRPSWNLPVLGGGKLSLDQLRGNVVIASYGATWCPPCRAELPALQALADEYQGKNVKVLWISIDEADISDQGITSFTQRLGVKFPVLRDPSGSSFDQFGEESIPILVVIDKQGKLVGRPHAGFSDKQTFLQRMRQIIGPLL